MSENVSQFVAYNALSENSPFFTSVDMIAHPVVHRPLTEEGLWPWPQSASDAPRAVSVFGADSADNSRGGGALPFPETLDRWGLNAKLGDQPDDPETTIQHAYLDNRPGTYHAVLNRAMGRGPDAVKEVDHTSGRYIVSQGIVGTPDQQDGILHSLVSHITQTHKISRSAL